MGAKDLTSIRGVARERARAREWFKSLDSLAKWDLGDQLVLGDFDWRDWFDDKPSGVFMNEVDRERIFWEETRTW